MYQIRHHHLSATETRGCQGGQPTCGTHTTRKVERSISRNFRHDIQHDQERVLLNTYDILVRVLFTLIEQVVFFWALAFSSSCLLEPEADEAKDGTGPEQQGELVAEQLLQELDPPVFALALLMSLLLRMYSR